jgi:hypothetical protein
MQNLLIFATMLGVAILLIAPRLAQAPLWRATITPLASIIGSGFLVLGPVLSTSFGAWAPLAMLLLCIGAYAFGDAIRFNIAARAEATPRSATETRLETLASWALAFAYVISVAYYLNLFGAFAVSLTEVADAAHAHAVTSAVLIVILMTGWTRGFTALERLEQISVGLKLVIIAGLLAGLAWFMAGRAAAGALVIDAPRLTGWPAVALLFGLIVTVQGFETARYLGAEYNSATRIRAMWLAQTLSTAIYLAYVCLSAYVFPTSTVKLTETAILDMMGLVAPILPGLLVIAALSAQFSAAIADTGGAGGLVAELTGGRITPRKAYAALVAAGLALTWFSDVFSIIAYASRAFALYYALQSAIAAVGARNRGLPLRAAAYTTLGLLGLAITAFGTSVE